MGSAGNLDNSTLIFALEWKEPRGLEISLQNIPLTKNFIGIKKKENRKPPAEINPKLEFLKAFKTNGFGLGGVWFFGGFGWLLWGFIVFGFVFFWRGGCFGFFFFSISKGNLIKLFPFWCCSVKFPGDHDIKWNIWLQQTRSRDSTWELGRFFLHLLSPFDTKTSQ